MVYNTIGKNYDITRHADPYLSQRLLFHLRPKLNAKYLDVACGSGNYTLFLSRSGLQICGVDISEYMLQIAQRKDDSVHWILSDAKALPFSGDSFSGVTCILGIHHFDNLQLVFNEISRVIEEGQFVIFTASAEQMEGYWLNEYFPKAMLKSIHQMPKENNLMESLHTAGFNKINVERYEIRDDLQDFFLYSGKNRPEIYLDPQVHKGISTFAALAEPEEIEKGCLLLQTDIHSGRINQVIKSYVNLRKSDYLFVIGEK